MEIGKIVFKIEILLFPCFKSYLRIMGTSSKNNDLLNLFNFSIISTEAVKPFSLKKFLSTSKAFLIFSNLYAL